MRVPVDLVMPGCRVGEALDSCRWVVGPMVGCSAGRPTGFAAVGLLQVRAFALIPFGDGLRPPCASLAHGTHVP